MIYNFLEYKPYLESKLGGKGTRTGARKRLSEYLQVHTTFVSQVLLDKAEFSLEQAEGCNDFLGHDENEAEYFLLLVNNLETSWTDLVQVVDIIKKGYLI